MNPTDLLGRIASAAALLTALVRQLVELRTLLHRLLPATVPSGYENLSLDLVLDIRDREGRRAVLERRQRVHVLSDDAPIIRDPVWGEGRPLARYQVSGASRLQVRAEGSRQAVLLSTMPPLAKGGRATLRCRRLIRDGLRNRTEYCEALVERPTGRLTIKVLFPPTRPPREAYLVSTPEHGHQRTVRLRYGADGRPFLAWRLAKPAAYTLYSLCWRW